MRNPVSHSRRPSSPDSGRRAAAVFALFILFAARLACAGPLPATVAAGLKAVGIPESAVGIVVQEIGRDTPRLAVNAGQPMNPASVMKLVTTWVALETLGPAYTWKTEAFAQKKPGGGVLDGDLYLRGGGDPKLTLEQFWLLLRQLRARGVREIRGDLVLDRNLFAPAETVEPFDDQPLRPYNVAPDALLLNFKALTLTLVPDAAQQRVQALPEPAPDNLEIVNAIRLGNNGCGEWKDALKPDLARNGTGWRLTLAGSYSAACGEKRWNLGVLPHDQFVFGVFRALWRELGGQFSGGLRNAPVPAEAVSLAAIDSPTLAETVRDINKYSNNVMARQLFLTLAAERPATAAGAAAAVRAWLAARGLDFPELVLDNGSGLSRRERIGAAHLARLLAAAAASPLQPEFVASLPLTAVDGTMKKRLNEDGIAGHGHIKTGTLDGVKSLAGYVQDSAGREVIVVFLVNHANAQQAQAAQDALLSWVYAGR